jgi:hypothetical protein
MLKVIFGIPAKIDCSKLPKRTQKITFYGNDYATAVHPDDEFSLRRFYLSLDDTGALVLGQKVFIPDVIKESK